MTATTMANGLMPSFTQREGLMALGQLASDLCGRRKALGATDGEMATGLGITLDELDALERGATLGHRLSFYSAWLSRLEAAAPTQRKWLFRRAADGERFD
jgi:hypothetical protein